MNTMPETSTTPVSQLYVRAAAILAVIVSIGFTWLVLVAGALQANVINLLTQALIIAVVATLLWMVIRRFKRTREELKLAQLNAEKEAALLRSRSAFIYSASSLLSKKLETFEQAIAHLDPSDKNVGPLKKKTAELRTMLNRLDTISKLEATMALTSSSKTDVVDALDEIAKTYQPVFSQKGATIQVTGSGEPMVTMDTSTLKEVITSIVDNAAKFMPASGGLLDIEYAVKRNKVIFTFTDNGPGIERSKMAELFKPFSRTDGVMAFDRQGQGLSLYIDKLCVEISGGSITIASQVGKGTTVTIELPAVG